MTILKFTFSSLAHIGNRICCKLSSINLGLQKITKLIKTDLVF